ncbi:MAG: hypothetical protein EA379_04520 [Phycisphaerales bacterium]|nr:MAG: hypothetical protein EA379_04520 [Phycisphaerales bacterium]
MPEMHLTITIDAPRERVFGVFADIPNAPNVIDGIDRIEMITEGPVGLGTRFRETRTMAKMQATEEFEVIGFEPPAHIALRCESCGVEYVADQRFVEQGPGAALVDFRMRSTPKTLAAKLSAPLTGLMMKSIMAKALRRDLEQLKAAAESPSHAPA